MHVGSGLFFVINTQEDLNRAMLASFAGIYDGDGIPEIRHIEELIDAVQNEPELAHLTLDIPDVLDAIRKDAVKNIQLRIQFRGFGINNCRLCLHLFKHDFLGHLLSFDATQLCL